VGALVITFTSAPRGVSSARDITPERLAMTPAAGPAQGSAGAPFGTMLRAALLPSTVIGVVTAIIVVLVRGTHAIAGSTFGLAVALAFFGFGMLVLSKLVREANVHLLFAVAMTVYFAQVIGLLIVVLIVRDAAWVDRRAMGIVIFVVTIVWQIFALRALRTARLPVYDEAAVAPVGEQR
jgi:ATP synthase protein I